MTAEVAILNKYGLALAADSKVTIGSGTKAFDTVTKIFPLSRIHPVALMIWGNPDFMQIPIEIICRQYRSQKGTISETTIAEWADNFVSYLKDFTEHDDTIKARNITSIIHSWFSEIRSLSHREASIRQIPPASSEYVKILSRQIKKKTSEIMAEEDFLPDEQAEAFTVKHWDTISPVVNEYVEQYRDEDLTKNASLLAIASLLKKAWSPSSMGFVIAGYGEDEIFPGFVEFESDGFLGDHLKVRKVETVQISRTLLASIRPFAQSDMVHRFMSGADPDYAIFADSLFRNSIVESCLAVLEEFGDQKHKTDAVRDVIKSAISNSADEAVKIRQQFSRENFSAPIINMVTMLPKDELPHLAESLVALTSLQRHVSNTAETVGGPIDVALISKGDGLIWIKRKHYFSAELNPQFTAKYLRSIMGGSDEKPKARRTRGKAPKDP